MSGSLVGGKKAAITNKSLYGDKFYHYAGRIGGLKRVSKGFAKLEASRKGGSISKRSK